MSMASATNPDRACSQFLIVFEENEKTRNLHEQYAVFGRVTSGIAIVDKIANLQTIGGSGSDGAQPVDVGGLGFNP